MGIGMSRRIRDMDATKVNSIDIEELTRRDQLAMLLVSRVLLMITTVVMSANAILSEWAHWSVVVLCASIMIASLVFLQTISNSLRNLLTNRKSIGTRSHGDVGASNTDSVAVTELIRHDVAAMVKISCVLLVVSAIAISALAISSGWMHWLVVVPTASGAIGVILFLPAIARMLRGLLT